MNDEVFNLTDEPVADRQPAPFDPRGTDYGQRWSLVVMRGNAQFVPDDTGLYVMRKGKPVRLPLS